MQVAVALLEQGKLTAFTPLVPKVASTAPVFVTRTATNPDDPVDPKRTMLSLVSTIIPVQVPDWKLEKVPLRLGPKYVSFDPVERNLATANPVEQFPATTIFPELSIATATGTSFPESKLMVAVPVVLKVVSNAPVLVNRVSANCAVVVVWS